MHRVTIRPGFPEHVLFFGLCPGVLFFDSDNMVTLAMRGWIKIKLGLILQQWRRVD